MTGRLVYAGVCTDQVLSISTSGLRSGVYAVVVNIDGKDHVKRLVLE